MSLEYFEMQGSPTYERREGRLTVTRRYKCEWPDRFAVMAELDGSEDPDISEAVCDAIRINPFPAQNLGSNNLSSYEYAVVEATFSSEAGSVNESFEPSADFLTLDETKFRWTDDGGDELTENEAPGKLNVLLDYIVRWRGLTSIPVTVFSAVGHVNHAALNPGTLSDGLLINQTFEAQTLLYHPPVADRRLVRVGETWEWRWDVITRFTYRPNWDSDNVSRGWNWFWRAASEDFEQLYSTVKEDTVKIYPTADLSPLFS